MYKRQGLRELSMRDAVNDYIEATGANHAIYNDEQAILYLGLYKRKETAALKIKVAVLNCLVFLLPSCGR